jgi:putative endonuclease
MIKGQDDRKQTGAAGERIAEQLLRVKGYSILELNWRCKSGELDIIAEIDNILVIVEVRTRKRLGSYGTAKESVTPRKQQQVRETAQYYLHRSRKYDQSIRFDVITVNLSQEMAESQVEHIQGAF